MDKEKKTEKKVIELDELEKVTGGTGTPKKEPTPISPDTKKNI